MKIKGSIGQKMEKRDKKGSIHIYKRRREV
jgi:hypothetical protein